jgi:hypothetical protein
MPPPKGYSIVKSLPPGYTLIEPSRPKASLSATELAPGVPIPGMPTAPKVNMQYQGLVPSWINDIRGMSDSEVADARAKMQQEFLQKRADQPGQQDIESGISTIRNAKSGNEVAYGVSDLVRGASKAYLTIATTQLGGAAVQVGRQGVWPLLKLMGQVSGTALTSEAAGQATEKGMDALGVGGGYARLGGDAARFVTPAAAMKLYDYFVGKLPDKGPLVQNTNPPERQQQVDMLKRMGVQLDKGQENNNDFVRKLSQSGQNRLGTSTMAEQFYKDQAQQLADAAQKVVDQPIPGRPPVQSPRSRFGTGEDIADKLKGVVARLKSQADEAYSSVRGQAAQQAKSVQVGEQAIPPSLIVDPSGNPAIPARTVPVMRSIEAPVDVRPMRQSLRGVYDELNSALPPVQKERNPAFTALKSLMESPDDAMPAVNFDRFLGALKSITRNGDNPYLTNTAQGLAKKVIASGEEQLKASLGSEILAKLTEGRSATRQYHEVADFMAGLSPEEPGRVVSKLLSGSDISANALKTLQKNAPETVDQLGKMYLQELVDLATQEGGFNRSAGLLKRWNDLGKETKQVLFGDKSKDIETFLLAAKDVTKMWNPSGSGPYLAIQEAMYRLFPSTLSLLAGNPLPVAGQAAYIAGNRKIGKMLLDQNPNSLDSLIELSKIMSRPMGIKDYYRTGAPLIPMAVGDKPSKPSR